MRISCSCALSSRVSSRDPDAWRARRHRSSAEALVITELRLPYWAGSRCARFFAAIGSRRSSDRRCHRRNSGCRTRAGPSNRRRRCYREADDTGRASQRGAPTALGRSNVGRNNRQRARATTSACRSRSSIGGAPRRRRPRRRRRWCAHPAIGCWCTCRATSAVSAPSIPNNGTISTVRHAASSNSGTARGSCDVFNE